MLDFVCTQMLFISLGLVVALFALAAVLLRARPCDNSPYLWLAMLVANGLGVVLALLPVVCNGISRFAYGGNNPRWLPGCYVTGVIPFVGCLCVPPFVASTNTGRRRLGKRCES